MKGFIYLLPRILFVFVFIGITGFASSSNTIVSRACNGEKITITTRVSDDECKKTETIYGKRAFGLCWGDGSKCKEETIEGSCDEINPD